MILKPDEETDEYVKYNSSVTFTEDVRFKKTLIVRGDINALNINARKIVARNIDAWNINARKIVARNINARKIVARNIDAWNINARKIVARNINALNIVALNIVICETIKIEKGCTLKTKTLITKRSEREFKEWKV